MLKNYLTIALRTLRKQKIYSAINVFGLAVGLACATLIFSYVRLERSFDRFHENADRIYRAVQHQPGNVFLGSDRFVVTQAPLGQALREEAPEVEAATTFSRNPKTLVIAGDERFLESGFWADAGFLEVFSFPLRHGDPRTALSEPDGLVLTESLAHKLFGGQNPMGASVQVAFFDSLYTYSVTGIAADPPGNSHLQFAFLRPLLSSPDFVSNQDDWGNSSWYTYATLRPGTSQAVLDRSLTTIFDRHWEREEGDTPPRLYSEALTSVHLHSRINFDIGENGDARLVALFTAIGILILLLACVNYTNLAVARSAQRAREVGMRKVSGARRSQLIGQYLTESVLTALLALGLGLGLAWLALPLFESWMERDLRTVVFSGPTLLALVGIAGVVGLVAGAYPALVLTGMKPARILKGQEILPVGRIRLRSLLVVGQYASALVLVIGSLVIYRQLDFIQQRPLGFDREHVVSMVTRGLDADRVWALKQEIARLPGVVGVTASSTLPTNVGSSTSVEAWTGHPEGSGEDIKVYQSYVDTDFLALYEMEVIAGRGFSEAFSADTSGAYVINETAAAAFGWTPETAIGKVIEKGEGYPVVGVVRDFHLHSMHQPIAPLMLQRASTWVNHLSVRVRPEGLDDTIAALGHTWSQFSSYPFDYAFLDEDFDQLYAAERRLGEGVATFTVIALFIACLGLFGLAAYTAERRTKEVGIRKVLGASVASLVGLLSRDFLLLVVVSLVVAAPVAYVAMSRWLETFAYRVDLGPGLFIGAGILALGIAFLTVSTQALRAASADPVQSLRYE